MLDRLLSFLGLGLRPPAPSLPRIPESQLLELFRAAGLDWSRSVDVLVDEYGATPFGEHSSAVYLPPTTALTPYPIRFYVRFPGMHDHCPPSQYCADIAIHGDAAANLRAVREALDDLLGGGADDATSNSIGQKWEIGVFRIAVAVWPRRLNSADTRTDAFLTVTSRIPHAPPDDSLRAIASLSDGEVLSTAPRTPAGWVWHLSRENFATRRNPPGCFDSIDDVRPLLWQDTATDRIGITGRDVSFCFSRSGVRSLEVLDEPPDRSPWCSRGIEILLQRRGGGVNRVTLGQAGCHMNNWSAADPTALARELAAFWNVPSAARL